MESQNKENCYITKVSSSSSINDDEVQKNIGIMLDME